VKGVQHDGPRTSRWCQSGAWTFSSPLALPATDPAAILPAQVVTPFLPGDSLLFAAGSLAALGHLGLLPLLGTFITAAILGDAVNYAAGQFFGEQEECHGDHSGAAGQALHYTARHCRRSTAEHDPLYTQEGRSPSALTVANALCRPQGTAIKGGQPVLRGQD
jgi:hypothetical protein